MSGSDKGALLAAGPGINTEIDPDKPQDANPVVNPDVDAKDRQGRSALHRAVEAGDFLAAAALLNEGANPNLADRTGRTPLHYAVLVGSADMVAMLLAAGADVCATDRHKVSPMDLARENNQVLPVMESSLEDFTPGK